MNRISKLVCNLILAALIAGCSSGNDVADADYAAASGAETNVRIVRVGGYQDVLDLFDELGYTPAAWQAGIRSIPRIYISEISDRWNKVTTQEIDVTLKKRIFFRAVGPLALRSNELILADRKRLKEVISGEKLTTDDTALWLAELASTYGLAEENYTGPEALATELLERVDIVPASLTLAQAAEESGWGTSRFAFTGNALFGQWTWGDAGIRPEQQRNDKGDYKIAAFESPLQAVQAHSLNLNSHTAYAGFRAMRARLRKANERISGTALAGTLTRYSERGDAYVKTLRSIINYNQLDPVDDAYLDDGQPIVLVRDSDDSS